MTYSGSSTGSGIATDDNLRWDRYEDFAAYFLDVVNYIQDNLKIHQNYFNREKDSYDPEKFSALSKIYEITGRELARRQRDGKLHGITICGTDETSIDEACLSFRALTEEAKRCIFKIATHGYSGSRRAELREIASAHAKKLWMSEVCYGGGRWNPEAMDSGCFSLSGATNKDLYELKATGPYRPI